MNKLFDSTIFFVLPIVAFDCITFAGAKKDPISQIPTLAGADAEKFYKDNFGKFQIETMPLNKVLEMPEQVRLLDARIYAQKIFPNDPAKCDQLASLMAKDLQLHWFLRQNKFHFQMEKFPTPPFTLERGELIFNFNGNQIGWDLFKEKLGKEIILWKEGQMKNAWVGYNGIKTAPSSEKMAQLKEQAEELNTLTGPDYNRKFLELMDKGFVKAEIVPNKEGIKTLFMTIHADTPTDSPSLTHVHGYFAINIPSEDGKTIHRFVMGKERLEYNWKAQPGRLSLLDVRHHRHFSKNKQPIGTAFTIPEEKGKELYKELLNEVEASEIYGQHHFNCCSLQSKLLNLLGVNWDTQMHPLAYYDCKLVPPKGSIVEALVNTAMNTYFFLNGAGSVCEEAKEILSKRNCNGVEKAVAIPSFSELINPEVTYIDSPYMAGKRCLEVMQYRESFVSRFVDAVSGKTIDNLAVAKAKREIEEAVRFLVPPSMLLAGNGEEEKVNNLIENKIKELGIVQ